MPSKLKFTSEQIDNIIHLYNIKIETIESISKLYNCSVTPIRNILINNNIDLKSKSEYYLFNKEEEIKICKLYTEENKSSSYISELFKCSSSTILKILKKYKVSIKSYKDYNIIFSEKEKEEIYRLYTEENKSANYIARKINSNANSVAKLLKKNNIIMRKCRDYAKTFSPEEEIEICKLYTEEKKTIKFIATQKNINEKLIANILKKNNINIRKFLFDQKEEIEICKLYKSNFNMSYIAKIFRCSINPIKQILRKNNIIFKDKTEHCKALNFDDEKEVCRLYMEENKSSVFLAEKFNVNATTICNILDRYNIDRINNKSIIESKIEDFLIKNNIEFLINTRKIISPLELDFYLPEHKIAIECNGLYFHSKYSGQKNRLYHYDKYIQCKEQGITLLQFWEDDLNNKFNIIESMINNKIGKNSIKISACKCIIEEISFSEIKSFCNENHIQGQPASNNKGIGLFFEDKLVSLISYLTKDDQIIITRFCSLLNHNVRGGFSKLLKQLKKYNKNIITYSSNDISNGNLYLNTGFECTNETIDMYYRSQSKLLNRQKFMKHKLKKINGFVFDENLTEEQNMICNGYDVIYKSGVKTWLMKVE